MTSPGASRAACVVLDTNVCLDLFVFDDPRCAMLAQALATGALRAITREDCRDEWRRVLSYPVLGLDQARREQLVQRYDATMSACRAPVAETVALPRCADPDDQKFLELASAARAVALVTRDEALLVLARRVQRAAGFAILRPDAITPDWLRATSVVQPD